MVDPDMTVAGLDLDGSPNDPVGAWYAGKFGGNYEWPMIDLKSTLEGAIDHLVIAMNVLDYVSSSRNDQDSVIIDEMVRVGYVLDEARRLLTTHPRIKEEYESERAERDRHDPSVPS